MPFIEACGKNDCRTEICQECNADPNGCFPLTPAPTPFGGSRNLRGGVGAEGSIKELMNLKAKISSLIEDAEDLELKTKLRNLLD